MIDKLRTDGQPQTNGGRLFPHAPKHTSKLWLTKTFRTGDTRLGISMGARYVSRYFMNAANTAVMPSRSTGEGAVSVGRGKYDVSVNFANILNKKRYLVSQINGGGLLYPGEPFNATLTLRYRFQ